MDKVSDTGLIERLRYIADTDDGRFSGIDHTLNEAANELAAAQARSNLLACALRSLLSKCACCGGTGEVGTGIIQMEHPAMMSCFVCAGERGILLKECGK